MKRESTIARIMDVVKRISPKAKWQILWIIGNKLHFVLSGKVEKNIPESLDAYSMIG